MKWINLKKKKKGREILKRKETENIFRGAQKNKYFLFIIILKTLLKLLLSELSAFLFFCCCFFFFTRIIAVFRKLFINYDSNK